MVRVTSLAKGARVRFAAVPGQKYDILASPTLKVPIPWTSVGSAVSDAAGVLEIDDPVATGASRFYRLEPVQP